MAGLVIDAHLHVWDGTAAGLGPGPMAVGHGAQASASVDLFVDYGVAARAFGTTRCMWGADFPHALAGGGHVRNRHLLPREATFLSREGLDLVMGGTAGRVWFG